MPASLQEASRGVSTRHAQSVRHIYVPRPHSSWTARTARSRPSRRTTIAMVSSLEPWAMAMMLMFSPRNRREDAPGQAGRAAHSFADHRDQADVGVDLNRLQVAVRQFEREVLFQMLRSARSSSAWRTRKQKLWR